MKKITFIAIILASCQNKPKPLFTYKIIIRSDKLHVNGYFPDIQNDTIKALNDTAGYLNAYIKYSSLLDINTVEKVPLHKHITYTVLDTNNIDLKFKLPKKVIDSITNEIDKIRSNDLKKLKSK